MKRQIITAALCVLVVSVCVVSAHQEDRCLIAGGSWDDGNCSLSISVDISMDYPLELAQNGLVASIIDPFFETTKDDFLAQLQGRFIFGEQYGSSILDISYEEFWYSDDIVSLVFDIFEYPGGIHGYTLFQTYMFNLNTQKVLTLNDLFLPDGDPFAVIAPSVEAKLTEQLGVWANFSRIETGTGNDPENYRAFALDQDALLFYFGDYQVAPYAAGPQTVTIPLTDLSTILAPEFAP